MQSGIAKRLILFTLCFYLSSCNHSQVQLDTQVILDNNYSSQATDTPTTEVAALTPTSYTINDPTPIPAKFINPPEYMEEKFKQSAGWNWMEAVEGRRSAFQDSKNYKTTFYLVHEKNMIEVGETGSFSDVFVNFVLDQFITASTKERIIQFRNDHAEPGTYQTIIDGFIVELEIIESQNDYFLAIYETN